VPFGTHTLIRWETLVSFFIDYTVARSRSVGKVLLQIDCGWVEICIASPNGEVLGTS